MTTTPRAAHGRRHRARVLGTVVLATALCGAAFATTASAQAEERPGKSPAIGQEESEQLDAKALARLYDVPEGDALAFARDSRTFAGLSTELATKYPETFAGAAWAEKPGKAALLRFVGRPPADVVKAVEDLPFEVDVDPDARRSAEKQHEIAISAKDTLVEAGFDQVAIAPLVDGGFSATAWSEKEAEVPRLPAGITVDVVDKPLLGDLHSRGGGNVLDGGVRECTSGFAVISLAAGGETGISTAGHCSGLDRYQEPNTGTTYDMDFERQHYGALGDYEWHSTPTHIDPAEYFARNNEIRDVNSVSGVLPVNTPTCMFGQTSDVRWCDTVAFQNVIATFSGPAHCFLTLNATSSAQPGDSGGPVSWGTEADGLIKGFMTVGGVRRDVWVRASLMPSAIGVAVRTK